MIRPIVGHRHLVTLPGRPLAENFIAVQGDAELGALQRHQATSDRARQAEPESLRRVVQWPPMR